MRILVISDNFLRGGLEKHIASLANEGASRGDEFFFAFGNYSTGAVKALNGPIVHSLTFPQDRTIPNLKLDAQQIVKAIEEKEIDVIHAHPFASVLVSAVAAQACNVPLVFTHHGSYSYNFPTSSIEAVLFQHALSEAIAHIFTVSEQWRTELSTYYPETKVTYLPNPIENCKTISVQNHNPSKTWALVSRLDRDKLLGIKSFLKWLPDLPIDILDVYGTGDMQEELLHYCQALGISQQVKWYGYQDTWLQQIEDKNVRGVIGMDRVALEAAAAGLPVILLTSNSSPCGIMNLDRYRESRTCNFGGNALRKLRHPKELTAEMASLESNDAQLATVSELICDEFSSSEVYRSYRDVLSDISAKTQTDFVEFLYDRIEDSDPAIDSQATFYSIQRTMLTNIINPLAFNTYMLARDHMAEKNARGLEIFGLYESVQALGAQVASLSTADEARQNAIAKQLREAEQFRKRDRQEIELQIAQQLRSITQSHSWRIGRFITSPVRKLKERIHRK